MRVPTKSTSDIRQGNPGPRPADGGQHVLFGDPESGRRVLFAALALIPLAALIGAAIDFGMSFVMRQRLDAVAQSALGSALAQSRSLRDIRTDVGAEEMEFKGRSRADLVFNAQRPTLRDIRTDFTLQSGGAPNVFRARVSYVASVNTIFLRFVGLKQIDVEGEASTTWSARDAIVEERFEANLQQIIASGRKAFPPPPGWMSSAGKLVGGQVAHLAAAERYDGPLPPDDVKVAVELDTPEGNVSISKKFTAEPGAHQLRYWYRDRAKSEVAAPAWLCGTREEDIMWMSARDRGPAGDTNRVSVYLSADVNGVAPTGLALNSGARVDACYSSGYRWIERVVKIDVLTRGDYWLTFRGEGRADATGAAIANVLFCREPCMDNGALAAHPGNYPWKPGEAIFEDRFVGNPGMRSPPGWTVWPGGAAKLTSGPGGASGAVELDVASGEGFENQRMGRPFLLVPGFYALKYDYSVGPSSPLKAAACNYFGLEAALQRLPRSAGADTRRVTLIIDPDPPYLHPEVKEAGSRIEWYTARRVLERDVSGLRGQPLPDPSNAVDYCVGAPPDVAVHREVSFRVDKAGYYWISFAADGQADGDGGRIGAVQLVALGTRFSGQGIPRIIRHTERGDILTPTVGSLLVQPPGSSGDKALFRVQVQ